MKCENCEAMQNMSYEYQEWECVLGMGECEFMKIDFMLLDLCDAIYMMPGWDLSKGACMERGYAMAKDLIILGD